jgi:predicted RNA-binding Zn-ribbon protein involved in translation (DUF1610 family)
MKTKRSCCATTNLHDSPLTLLSKHKDHELYFLNLAEWWCPNCDLSNPKFFVFTCLIICSYQLKLKIENLILFPNNLLTFMSNNKDTFMFVNATWLPWDNTPKNIHIHNLYTQSVTDQHSTQLSAKLRACFNLVWRKRKTMHKVHWWFAIFPLIINRFLSKYRSVIYGSYKYYSMKIVCISEQWHINALRSHTHIQMPNCLTEIIRWNKSVTFANIPFLPKIL